MNRRQFLVTAGLSAASLGGCRYWPDDGFWHDCGPVALPEALARDRHLRGLWEGIDPAQFWDCHAHLLGSGDSGSGCWISPRLDSFWHPIQRLQKAFYLNAACVPGGAGMDNAYVQRLLALHAGFPRGAKILLLAFDWHYDEQGQRVEALSPFHTPNAYAARLAGEHPGHFEWIASVHPYRTDAVAALEQAARDGARAVKWLPPAQGMDPANPACDRFYQTLARLGLPLLTHAGEELAVQGGAMQDFGNPLRLRRALELGVRVILAHCASLGEGVDLDAGPDGPARSNFELFTRLMEEPRYSGQLFGEISALAQLLRRGEPLRVLLKRRDWQARLLYGSDYPLPAVLPIFSMRALVSDGFLDADAAAILTAVRRHNPLLFDFALKRLLRVDGQGFGAAVYATRAVFTRAG